MTAKMRRNVVTAIATVMLAITYVACGFVAVAGIPQMVHGLAMSYCNDDLSPFDKMQLVEAADATRDYTVGEHDYDTLMATIAQINDEADTPYAGASAEELAAADEQYTLTPDAISHLDDVNDVVNRAMPALLACAVLAGFCLLCSIYMFGPRSIGQPFAFAGGLVVAGVLVSRIMRRGSSSSASGRSRTSTGCSRCSIRSSSRRARGCSRPIRC